MRGISGKAFAIILGLMSMFILWNQSITVCAAQKDEKSTVRTQYEEYIEEFNAIKSVSDIEKYGFRIVEGQVFQEVFAGNHI